MSEVKTAKFTISGDNGKAHDVGYRVFILEKIMGYGLSSPTPKNLPDGSVEVIVRGGEESIRALYNELKVETPRVIDIGEIKVSEIEFGNYKFKKVEDKDLHILTLGQLNKGIPAILNIGAIVEGLDRKYGRLFLVLVLVLLVLIFGFTGLGCLLT